MWPAVRHLISLGHRRIAHIAGTAQAWVSSVRRAGYHAALEDAGIPRDAALVLRENPGEKWEKI